MKKIMASVVVTIALLTGCATTGSNNEGIPSANLNTTGVVIGVRPYTTQTNEISGTGAAVGGVAGGVLGNQIGKGRGKKLATVVGAVVGAGVGANVGSTTVDHPMLELTIQEGNGNVVIITQPDNANFYVGQRVTVFKQGNRAQVNPL